MKDSGARGLLFSPTCEVDHDGTTRADYVKKLMPELDSLYPGDSLAGKVSAFPNLRQVIQTGHSNIRGVIKYKDSLLYAVPQLSPYSLPQNETDDLLYECYRDGRKVSSLTSGEVASKSQQLW